MHLQRNEWLRFQIWVYLFSCVDVCILFVYTHTCRTCVQHKARNCSWGFFSACRHKMLGFLIQWNTPSTNTDTTKNTQYCGHLWNVTHGTHCYTQVSGFYWSCFIAQSAWFCSVCKGSVQLKLQKLVKIFTRLLSRLTTYCPLHWGVFCGFM